MLGSPTNRSGTPDPVRELSAASSVIIRILMHSALLWASSSYEVSTLACALESISGAHMHMTSYQAWKVQW